MNCHTDQSKQHVEYKDFAMQPDWKRYMLDLDHFHMGNQKMDSQKKDIRQMDLDFGQSWDKKNKIEDLAGSPVLKWTTLTCQNSKTTVPLLSIFVGQGQGGGEGRDIDRLFNIAKNQEIYFRIINLGFDTSVP